MNRVYLEGRDLANSHLPQVQYQGQNIHHKYEFDADLWASEVIHSVLHENPKELALGSFDKIAEIMETNWCFNVRKRFTNMLLFSSHPSKEERIEKIINYINEKEK